MKKKITILLCISLIFTLFITGCNISDFISTSSNSDTEEETETEESIKEFDSAARFSGDKIKFDPSVLESGMFYVKHSNNECEPVYFGEANFDVGLTSEKNDGVMWFKEDFNNIPTLFAGDSLIYYTTEELNEQFIFLRFEDFGYSIGVCGLKPTETNRYTISTDVADECTYPDGDTDAILYMENDKVIFESIGTVPLRYNEEFEQLDIKEIKGIYVSRVGTILNLAKNKRYDAVLYSGTVEHDCVFTSDVRILGFMEKSKTLNYVFEKDKNIITIDIPDGYQNGYYLINGVGMFRYVNGTEYSELTDFNVPNPEEVIDVKAINENKPEKAVEFNEQTMEQSSEIYDLKNEAKQSFTVRTPGKLIVNITFSNPDLPEDVMVGDVPEPKAYIEDPRGVRYNMAQKNGNLYLEIDAEMSGKYYVVFSDLYGRIPNIKVG